ALAETLWRDGQEDDAITLCRDILAQRPESLKANLLLGYLLMTSGDPAGERYWQAAERMDPYHGVARALFETLPPGNDEPPAIEEWDVDAWRRRRAADQQDQIAATMGSRAQEAERRDAPDGGNHADRYSCCRDDTECSAARSPGRVRRRRR